MQGTSVPHCTVCGSDALETSVVFGLQPLSTGFANAPQSEIHAATSQLSLGYCRSCGTMQLIDRFALEALRRKNPAVRFREPVAHLSQLAEKLFALGVVEAHSKVLGLTYIDADLLNVLADKGCHAIDCVDFEALAVHQANCGLESIAPLVLQPEIARKIRRSKGAIDVLCARFVLEHAESAYGFMTALLGLVRPGGHVVIEVPDASKMLAMGNHALIWEEHFTYFTQASLKQLVARLPATLVDMARYPYAYEDALVLILRADGAKTLETPEPGLESIGTVAENLHAFGMEFAARKANLHRTLSGHIAAGEKLALFGAGHHAAKYVNFYDLAELIEFAVDDNPVKQGLFMPGTDLYIHNSRHLLESGISICLSMLTPEAEIKVRQSIPAFFERGGSFILDLNLEKEAGNE